MRFSLGLKRWAATPVPWNSAYRSRVPSVSMFSTDAARVPEPVSFKLGDACKLMLQGGDITKWSVDGSADAIVNAANETMLGGGGVDGAIHAAAGKGLLNACKKLPLVAPDVRCRTGEAVVTPGFDLPVSRIIHTVGPIYSAEGDEKAAALLQAAYKNSLSLARSEGVKYIAFPAISCGIYGYPYDKAAAIAVATCKAECDGFAEIHFVLFQLPIFKEWIQAAEAAALPKNEANKTVEQRQL